MIIHSICICVGVCVFIYIHTHIHIKIYITTGLFYKELYLMEKKKCKLILPDRKSVV